MHDATPGEFNPSGFFQSFIRVTKTVLLSPGQFFEGMKQDGGFTSPFTYMVFCVAVHSFIAGMVLRKPALVIVNLVMGIGFPFITAAILFFIITRLFRAAGNYEVAFRVNAYASAISLLSWIPLAGPLLELYRIYVLVVGLREVFRIRTGQSFCAVLLTITIYIGLSWVINRITGGLLFR